MRWEGSRERMGTFGVKDGGIAGFWTLRESTKTEGQFLGGVRPARGKNGRSWL